MDPSINPLQPPDDDEETEQSLTRKRETIHQLSHGTFFSYCQHQFDQLHNASLSSNKMMQDNKIDLSSQSSIPKRRKTEIIELHNGRIVRSKGRKDRHSKVCTSKGPKDRRVRLAPGTAIQFYDVQDRLGYDRPSKAIDWLMKEAKSAIDMLDATENHSPIDGEMKKMQKHDHLKSSENHISGFTDTGPVHSEFRAWPDGDLNSYQDGFFSALTSPSQIFETNLQRIFANTEYSVMNNLPLQFSGPVSGQNPFITQREPLQSSFTNYPPISSEFNFYSEELSCFTAGETVKGKDKIPLVCNKSIFHHKEE